MLEEEREEEEDEERGTGGRERGEVGGVSYKQRLYIRETMHSTLNL